MRTASITKNSATIAYQSSGMLKAMPARAAADQARPIIAAPATKMHRRGDRNHGHEAPQHGMHQRHAERRLEQLRRRVQAVQREGHAADPDDDGQQMSRLQGRIQHE